MSCLQGFIFLVKYLGIKYGDEMMKKTVFENIVKILLGEGFRLHQSCDCYPQIFLIWIIFSNQ